MLQKMHVVLYNGAGDATFRANVSGKEAVCGFWVGEGMVR